MYLRPDSACLFGVVLPPNPTLFLEGEDLPASSVWINFKGEFHIKAIQCFSSNPLIAA